MSGRTLHYAESIESGDASTSLKALGSMRHRHCSLNSDKTHNLWSDALGVNESYITGCIWVICTCAAIHSHALMHGRCPRSTARNQMQILAFAVESFRSNTGRNVSHASRLFLSRSPTTSIRTYGNIDSIESSDLPVETPFNLLSTSSSYSHHSLGAAMESSSLNKLPPELRNSIYELALCPAEDITFSMLGDSRLMSNPSPTQRVLALTATCKQIRDECLLMFYAQNEFHVTMDLCDRTHALRSARRANTREDLQDYAPSSVILFCVWLLQIEDSFPILRQLTLDAGRLSLESHVLRPGGWWRLHRTSPHVSQRCCAILQRQRR